MTGVEVVRCACAYALTLPFTERCHPFGPEYDVFKVSGRIFMIAACPGGKPLINLKAEPEKALLHQAIYPGITPGYHMNKKHWISVYGGEKITPDLLASLIDDSWHRVVDKLPKRVQTRLRPPLSRPRDHSFEQ